MSGTAVASGSRVAHWANKLAVKSEPGLTHTQLMVRPLMMPDLYRKE